MSNENIVIVQDLEKSTRVVLMQLKELILM